MLNNTVLYVYLPLLCCKNTAYFLEHWPRSHVPPHCCLRMLLLVLSVVLQCCMWTSPLSFIVLVTFLFADHKFFKLLLLLPHMLVQARIKCLLKWFTDDKNDFHLSLDNAFYLILSAFLTDSKELCVFYGCVTIISMTFETFLLSIWMHWKAKCVHTDVAGHCFQTERRNSVCKEVISLSFCLLSLFLFSHSCILLSVCLLSRFLFVHSSILSVYLPISLSSYLSI